MAHLLDVHRTSVVGMLHHLWWWALDHADDGDVTQFDALDIAYACDWDGEPDLLLKALVECGPGGKAGFIEIDDGGRKALHDWWDYAGKLVARREADKARKRSERQPKSTVKDVQRTSNGRRKDGVRTNQPTNQKTRPPQPSVSASLNGSAADFAEWWKLYPNKKGKPVAAKAYAKALVKVTPDVLMAGLQQYVDFCRSHNTEAQYILHPSTWLNQERWSDELAATTKPIRVDNFGHPIL